MPATPTIADLIRSAIAANRQNLHTAMPGKVTGVDIAGGSVDVQPQLRNVIERDDGTFQVDDSPVIPNVPLVFQRSSGYSLRTPVVAGDTVLLIFSERDIGVWRAQGEPGVPGDNRAHTLSGAVAIPGLFPDSNAPTVPANLELGRDGVDAATIEITAGEVRLTKGATQSVARADRVESEIQTIVNAIVSAAVVGGDGGAAFKANIIAALNNPVGSTATDNVKAT